MTIQIVVLLIAALFLLTMLLSKRKRNAKLVNRPLHNNAPKNNLAEPPQKPVSASAYSEKKKGNSDLQQPSMNNGAAKQNTQAPGKTNSESELYVVRITYPWAVKYFIYPQQEQVLDPSWATHFKAEFAKLVAEKVNLINTDPEVRFAAVTLAQAKRDFNR